MNNVLQLSFAVQFYESQWLQNLCRFTNFFQFYYLKSFTFFSYIKINILIQITPKIYREVNEGILLMNTTWIKF